MIAFQDPSTTATTDGLVATLQSIGWVDKTALAVLLVFFVLGLFKGLIWQVSRIGILLAAYFVAGRFGHDVAALLGANPAGPAAAESAAANSAAATVPQGETTLYVAYCLLFVGVLIVLSLLAMLIKKLADRAGLGFFDRLGGGVLGVATGACVVLAGVFGINMFFPSSNLAQAAGDSHSLRWSQKAISLLDDWVDDDLRSVLALRPLSGSGTHPDTGDPNNQDGTNADGTRAGSGRKDNDGFTPRMPTPLPLPRGMTIEGGEGSPGPSPGRSERGGGDGGR